MVHYKNSIETNSIFFCYKEGHPTVWNKDYQNSKIEQNKKILCERLKNIYQIN